MKNSIVRVFEKIENEPQKGELVNPITGLKMGDCQIEAAENNEVLEACDHSIDKFVRIDDDDLDYILLKLK